MENLDLVVNYGQLQSVEFADISMVNVIIGPNNAGKTTFLKAILKHHWTPQLDVKFGLSISKIRTNSIRIGEKWISDYLNWISHEETVRRIAEAQSRTIPLRVAPLHRPLCLWHRRKSAYKTPMKHETELDAEATNMAPRLMQIRSSSDLGDRINEFVREVIPGCPNVTAGYSKQPSDKGQNVEISVGEHTLEQVGGGVEQTLAIAMALISESADRPLLIDEPETNLHPSSQRTLVRKIMAMRGERMLFITTHSPVILNEFSRHDDVRIYRIAAGLAENDRVEPCQTNKDIRSALDSIGAQPSDILQTDCVLWVEGPTEAIVLRHLLQLFFPEYVEHSDFQFMFTAGSLITHMGTDDGRPSTFCACVAPLSSCSTGMRQRAKCQNPRIGSGPSPLTTPGATNSSGTTQKVSSEPSGRRWMPHNSLDPRKAHPRSTPRCTTRVVPSPLPKPRLPRISSTNQVNSPPTSRSCFGPRAPRVKT